MIQHTAVLTMADQSRIMIYRTAPFSMILNDPCLQFQGLAILWRWTSHKRFDIQKHSFNEQELSYRQQIARQLRTQYAEGIYRHKYYTVTLKSRLRVTEGHWKRNHWIDHTRLSSSRVIWRWILLWPWNVGYRSLKVIKSGTIWKLWYGFLFAFHTNYGRICSHFGDIQRQKWSDFEIWVWGPSRSLRMARFDRRCMTLLVRHCNYSSVLYHLRVIWR